MLQKRVNEVGVVITSLTIIAMEKRGGGGGGGGGGE